MHVFVCLLVIVKFLHSFAFQALVIRGTTLLFFILDIFLYIYLSNYFSFFFLLCSGLYGGIRCKGKNHFCEQVPMFIIDKPFRKQLCKIYTNGNWPIFLSIDLLLPPLYLLQFEPKQYDMFFSPSPGTGHHIS